MFFVINLVGLTGGVSSGKSTVSNIFLERGIPVISSNAISRSLLRPNHSCYQKVIDEFGEDFLVSGPGSEIDRSKLGREVYSNHDSRKKLQSIVWPPLFWRTLSLSIYHYLRGATFVVYDAPLLLESRFRHLVKPIVVVYTKPELQLQRLLLRDGVTEGEARKRIESQLSIDLKVGLADYVINNNGSIDYTEEQVDRFIKSYSKNGQVLSKSRRITVWFILAIWIALIAYILNSPISPLRLR